MKSAVAWGSAILLGSALWAGSAAAQTDSTDRLLVSDQAYLGWKYFEVYCARCHGDDARGTMSGADLTYSLTEEGGVGVDSFFVMVRQGATDGKMKGFEDLLDQPLIQAIYAYVKARSEDRVAPGRPHRAPPPDQ